MKGVAVLEKLVRDKIPKIMKEQGVEFSARRLTDEEYPEELKRKLLEEACEFCETPTKEELIDILEVIDAIAAWSCWTRKDLQEAQEEKRHKKGGFLYRWYVE